MIDKIKKMCNNGSLLYITKFGSHLYGLNTPESDTDYKGVFIPSKKSCLLGKMPKSITYSSGNGNSRNDKEDIDIQLWSLQYFMELVGKGETNALDLLYSFTYPKMIIYKKPIMDYIFLNHNKLYNLKNCKAYIGYAIGQAKKYGIKGSRLGVLKNVLKKIKERNNNDTNDIKALIIEIDRCFHDDSFCFLKTINGIQSLVLCGKIHQGNIKFEEFYNRIETEYNKYGNRAILAEKNEGIDWKALSHAVRSLEQMEMLINNGIIEYPLKNFTFIKEIKMGKVDFIKVEKYICDKIEKIKEKLKDVKSNKDKSLFEKIILKAYDNFTFD